MCGASACIHNFATNPDSLLQCRSHEQVCTVLRKCASSFADVSTSIPSADFAPQGAPSTCGSPLGRASGIWGPELNMMEALHPKLVAAGVHANGVLLWLGHSLDDTGAADCLLACFAPTTHA